MCGLVHFIDECTAVQFELTLSLASLKDVTGDGYFVQFVLGVVSEAV